MRLTAAEKHEVIRLVEGSDRSVRQTLQELQVNRATFYAWYRRYRADGEAGLATKPPAVRRYWNRIPPPMTCTSGRKRRRCGIEAVRKVEEEVTRCQYLATAERNLSSDGNRLVRPVSTLQYRPFLSGRRDRQHNEATVSALQNRDYR